MAKVDIAYTDYLNEMLTLLGSPGLLLASVDAAGKPNTMTIGWGTLGIVWGKPIYCVLVRPSRFSFGLIEETKDFTVNVPYPEMSEIVAYCGTVSGRDHDKFAEKGLTATPGRTVKSPAIEECAVHYECKVVHKNNVLPAELAPAIGDRAYPQGDFHTIYFGEILAAYADEDAAERLGGG
ncbi:MAG: flavin reductase family protein [Armatimonadota bacterium]